MSFNPPNVEQHVEFVRAKKILKGYKPDESILTEVKKLHSQRLSPKLHLKKNLNIKHIRKALILDQAYRSRLIELKSLIEHDVDQFDLIRDKLKVILYNSANDTPSNTKAERKEYIAMLVDGLFVKVDLAYIILEQLKIFIEDIDKSKWSLDSVIKTFELNTRPEVNY